MEDAVEDTAGSWQRETAGEAAGEAAKDTAREETRAAEAKLALVTLFREHQLSLTRTALMIVGDRPTAEDVVQDAFVEMHRRIDRITDHDRMLPYVRAAVVNRCRSVLRRRRLAPRLWRTYEPPVWSAESAALIGEDRAAVFHALRRLPERQREALVLRYYLDLDEPEIAEVMGISRSTVRSATSRALAALARDLGEES
ncbi:SigE family RNA polymerase sigma factor [Actinomadura litoris]|uniref:SigE family RNA polymerase sigma factor n=1 Tax=Actinomadura litoris TaxID=2678616 RepID=UPI0027BA6544|nr:SigE family RNA polymerase sigma factor [Actinomadura litoris]